MFEEIQGSRERLSCSTACLFVNRQGTTGRTACQTCLQWQFQPQPACTQVQLIAHYWKVIRSSEDLVACCDSWTTPVATDIALFIRIVEHSTGVLGTRNTFARASKAAQAEP